MTVLLLTVWRERMRGSLLPLACAATAVWAIVLVVTGLRAELRTFDIFLIEMIHDGVWLVYLASLMGGAIVVKSNWLVRYGGVLAVLALLTAGLLIELSPTNVLFGIAHIDLLLFGSIATALFGLVGVEQVFRNARPTQQNGLKFLCLGVGSLFAYDLFFYSNAIVFAQLSELIWNVRGVIVAMCAPLIAVAVRRNKTWNQGIFMSRQVVFYTTTLAAAGIYLVAISFAGYYIQRFGREWGAALQIIFFFAAFLALLLLVLSDQLRARFNVLLMKHFFERKYDYRKEWLRLVGTLTAGGDDLPLQKRAIKSLAQIVKSDAGHLWMPDSHDDAYEAVASWNLQPVSSRLSNDDPLVVFLRDTGWVVDVGELRQTPDRYREVSVDALDPALVGSAFIIPLLHEDELTGFVALAEPRTSVELNFEDHDLLKTVGQQVASYLMQQASSEQLAESRQFEAYNRFTAYVMHDLKNAISQQSLVVKNAEKHKRNPEFIDDAIRTIDASVARMRRVITNLKQGAFDQPQERVDLTRLVLQAESQCSDRAPVPKAVVPDTEVVTLANRDRLLMAVCHAIRNAQDATPDDGEVSLELSAVNGEGRLAIRDTGAGMDEAFIRERLFRPFDSTKGAGGMGIGAYQIRETLRMSGGDIDVESAPDHGSTITMRLPLE